MLTCQSLIKKCIQKTDNGTSLFFWQGELSPAAILADPATETKLMLSLRKYLLSLNIAFAFIFISAVIDQLLITQIATLLLTLILIGGPILGKKFCRDHRCPLETLVEKNKRVKEASAHKNILLLWLYLIISFVVFVYGAYFTLEYNLSIGLLLVVPLCGMMINGTWLRHRLL